MIVPQGPTPTVVVVVTPSGLTVVVVCSPPKIPPSAEDWDSMQPLRATKKNNKTAIKTITAVFMPFNRFKPLFYSSGRAKGKA
jgi:hypothetical protein